MNLWGRLLRLAEWSVDITAPRRDKCVICVAPHTSNWDFILGLAAYRSLGRKANFLMKEFWFFFPLKYLLTSLGGIPVSRKGSGGLTRHIVDMFGSRGYMHQPVQGGQTSAHRRHARRNTQRAQPVAHGIPAHSPRRSCARTARRDRLQAEARRDPRRVHPHRRRRRRPPPGQGLLLALERGRQIPR